VLCLGFQKLNILEYIIIVNSRSFKCYIDAAKRNAKFGKIERIVSEEVTLQLIQSKSVPLLLYGLEACPLNKSQLNSPNLVWFGVVTGHSR